MAAVYSAEYNAPLDHITIGDFTTHRRNISDSTTVTNLPTQQSLLIQSQASLSHRLVQSISIGTVVLRTKPRKNA